MQLWVQPNGSRLWRLAYRFDGKQRKLAIGPYPLVSLSDARKKRDEAKALLLAGIDPGQQKKADRQMAADGRANTFNKLADELLDRKRRENKAGRTLQKLEWLFTFTEQTIGPRPVAEITSPEVLAVLQKVEAKGRHETAARLRALIGEVFRLAIATGRAVNDPTFALRGALIAPVVKHHAAITTAKEFGALLRAIDGFTGQPTTKAALQLMALLFQRPGELRAAEWSEFDLESAVWSIPAPRMKMRRAHRVPLPLQAVAILEGLKSISGGGVLVFPGLRSVKTPISENTLNAALRRLGYDQTQMTAHGFRAAASTLLNESGRWSVDAIERALAHLESNEVRRAYARGEHWDERVKMAAWWADHLDTLRDGAKVLPFSKGTA